MSVGPQDLLLDSKELDLPTFLNLILKHALQQSPLGERSKTKIKRNIGDLVRL